MARHLAPDALLIAETGGLNAMVVDSSALPEQVVRDVLASSFQSAGQRCSALRMLYVQKDVADKLLEMLFGAMDELKIGDPWLLSSDVGPVIDLAAKSKIENHCRAMADKGRLLKQIPIPDQGLFVAPTVISLDGIEQLEEEIFGPVLHVATFQSREIDQVIDAINARGYGLTFGIHTRVDNRVEQMVERIRVGNIYVNRNQIGAVVGTQPFGGEGLSGTGPKAGGPSYLPRLRKFPRESLAIESSQVIESDPIQSVIDRLSCSFRGRTSKLGEAISAVIETLNLELKPLISNTVKDMPGPTGEINRLSSHPRGVVLCLGPTKPTALAQAISALSQGNAVVIICNGITAALAEFARLDLPLAGIDGSLESKVLQQLSGYDAVMSQADPDTLKLYRQALAGREGVLIPLITEAEADAPEQLIVERHLCIDTTAAGGNASLIAAGS
jgi:RHH-type proline utilization regulon transcriptional repressor/proline dehydrogenase/delta 1-pyrroline-5-carboxylate dehydrogenase